MGHEGSRRLPQRRKPRRPRRKPVFREAREPAGGGLVDMAGLIA